MSFTVEGLAEVITVHCDSWVEIQIRSAQIRSKRWIALILILVLMRASKYQRRADERASTYQARFLQCTNTVGVVLVGK